jgi:hypothetical protein
MVCCYMGLSFSVQWVITSHGFCTQDYELRRLRKSADYVQMSTNSISSTPGFCVMCVGRLASV